MFIQTRVKTNAQNKYTKYLVLPGPLLSGILTLFCLVDFTLGVEAAPVSVLIGRSVGFLISVVFFVCSTERLN